jgi:hypothetical protein
VQRPYTGVSDRLSRAMISLCLSDSGRCGGAIGIYFLVKRCSLLYLYIDKGTFASPPYLDDHGEVDMSMRCVQRLAGIPNELAI